MIVQNRKFASGGKAIMAPTRPMAPAIATATPSNFRERPVRSLPRRPRDRPSSLRSVLASASREMPASAAISSSSSRV